MPADPIVEEVRRVREAYAARFNYDPEAIFQDIKRQEQESGRTPGRFEKRPWKTHQCKEGKRPWTYISRKISKG
jgi:hypothetical protein